LTSKYLFLVHLTENEAIFREIYYYYFIFGLKQGGRASSVGFDRKSFFSGTEPLTTEKNLVVEPSPLPLPPKTNDV